LIGYVENSVTGRKLRYRLNGLRVLAITIAAWARGVRSRDDRMGRLLRHRWRCSPGRACSGWCSRSRSFCPLRRAGTLAEDLTWERLANPQLGGGFLDARCSCTWSARSMLELNVLSFAAHHLQTYASDTSTGVIVYAALFTFFVTEYLYFEEVHLLHLRLHGRACRLQARVGCLVFYPFFYLRRPCGRSRRGPTRRVDRMACRVRRAVLLGLGVVTRREPSKVCIQSATPRPRRSASSSLAR
jgi:delta14-sterol reductase